MRDDRNPAPAMQPFLVLEDLDHARNALAEVSASLQDDALSGIPRKRMERRRRELVRFLAIAEVAPECVSVTHGGE